MHPHWLLRTGISFADAERKVLTMCSLSFAHFFDTKMPPCCSKYHPYHGNILSPDCVSIRRATTVTAANQHFNKGEQLKQAGMFKRVHHTRPCKHTPYDGRTSPEVLREKNGKTGGKKEPTFRTKRTRPTAPTKSPKRSIKNQSVVHWWFIIHRAFSSCGRSP